MYTGYHDSFLFLSFFFLSVFPGPRYYNGESNACLCVWLVAALVVLIKSQLLLLTTPVVGQNSVQFSSR